MIRMVKVRAGTWRSMDAFLKVLLVMLGLCFSAQGRAAELEITASFSPDPANPNRNEFKNTTPSSGYCSFFSADCEHQNIFSLRTSLRTNPSKAISAYHTDPRDGGMVKVPADWRTLSVSGPSGETEVQVRLSGIGGVMTYSPKVTTITDVADQVAAHDALYVGNSWIYAPRPCIATSYYELNSTRYRFFWRTPSSSACSKQTKFKIDSQTFSEVDIAYQLKTPAPLELGQGVYTGSIDYAVGPNMDIDFGDVLIPTDGNLRLNFTLHVQHLLKFQFPPGGDRLTLYPKGGWQQWLNSGRRPEKLEASQDFKMWSSTKFSMNLQCEHSSGSQCAIKNPEGIQVPVITRVTLPSGLLDSSNGPVNRYLLSAEKAIFHPTYYVDNGRAALHFEVERDDVSTMIDQGTGTTYSGDITIVFDSNI